MKVTYHCSLATLFATIAENKTGCRVEDILVFFTGANTVPPLGLDKKMKVTFLEQEKYRTLCTASTCDLDLRLLTCHGEDYQSFKKQ